LRRPDPLLDLTRGTAPCRKRNDYWHCSRAVSALFAGALAILVVPQTIVERDYRSVIAGACYADASCDGALAVVRYDVTALDFKTDLEDSLRKVGVSKGRRVDAQITVGLLTSSTGFPLQVHLFEGSKAETTTLPRSFRLLGPSPAQQHRVDVLAGADLR
jgi:hypothetical protein